MHDDLIELIKQRDIAFPEFGSGIRKSTIADAEQHVGIPFPETYKWWLENYGGGQISGDIVYGLDEDGIGMPDIVQLATMNEQQGVSAEEKLVFCIGNKEEFFFDTRKLVNGEYPVQYLEIGEDIEHDYASNFADFLRKRIIELT